MKLKDQLLRHWVGGAAVALVTAALGLCLREYTVGRRLINLSYDLLQVARPPITADEAVLVYMDEDSYTELKQARTGLWDRTLHAQLIDRLTRAGARAVAFDIYMPDPSPTPGADAAMAAAMRRNSNVVLAADVKVDQQNQVNSKSLRPSCETLLNEVRAIGSDEVDPGLDLIVRQHTSSEMAPTLSWVIADVAGAAATKPDASRPKVMWVNYYGPPGSLPHTSYHLALDQVKTPDSVFRGKVVFVGARLLTKSAGERKDEYRAPHTYWIDKNVMSTEFIAGVEIQATMFLNLLRGDWLTRLPDWTERVVIAVLGLVLGYGLVQSRTLLGIFAALAAGFLLSYAAYALFTNRLVWFPWLIVVGAQIPAALVCSVLFNSVQLYVQKKLFEQTLGLYLSPKLVKKFAKDDSLLKPGAHKQTLTILFSDIANFTSISEGMDSDDLAKSMNKYFQKSVSDCIFPTEGTVVKYIGDAIFAFWNAPDHQHDHALRACQAALLFRDLGTMEMNGQTLITRIGLHTGVANVGNFGSTERVDYTALGENINLASRMEGLNKYLGTILLATGDTFNEVSDKIVSRFAGRFKLKGFERAVDVHELIGTAQQAEESKPWREAFAQALKHFQQKNFQAAEAGFHATIKLHPNDGPSKFYLKQIEELKEHPLPDDWNGDTELKEK